MSFILVPMKSFHPFSSHRSQTTKIQAYWGQGVWETMTDEFLSCSGTCLGHIFPDISACKSVTLEAWTIIKKKQCLHILKEPSQPSHFKESRWIKSINAHQCTCSYAIIWMYHLHYHVVDFSLVSSIASRRSSDWSSDGLKKSLQKPRWTWYYTVLHTHNTQIIYIHICIYSWIHCLHIAYHYLILIYIYTYMCKYTFYIKNIPIDISIHLFMNALA